MEEKKKILLRDFVKETKDNKICIGTINGSGFIYIGDDPIEGFNVICNVIKGIWEHKNSQINELQEELMKLVKMNPTNLGEALVVANAISEVYRKLTRLYIYMENYKNPEERVVYESKHKRSFDNRLCIIIEGSESTGKSNTGYWFKEEYDSGHIDYSDEEDEEDE